MKHDAGLVWFRRDLRLEDNGALAAALATCRRVYCAFVFDRAILDPLLAAGAPADRRVEFIHAAITELDARLRRHGAGLVVLHASAAEAIPRLARDLAVEAVFAAEDYEPYARERDGAVERALAADGRRFVRGKDHVIFEKSEVVTGAGRPFGVFTPYKNAWLRRLTPDELAPRGSGAELGRLAAPPDRHSIPTLESLGFARSNLAQLSIPTGESGGQALFDEFKTRIDRYDETRNFPAVRGPSYLSVHLRFGTVSIRSLARFAVDRNSNGARTWLSELVWRDFYQMILWHHPHVVGRAYRPEYDAIEWESGPAADAAFAAWRAGRTGYPLVDAAMAQINQSGYMHNRLRMVVASFLTKDLGIDWRRGEAYFARHLNDFDLAANNGGWQWAASTGCDAQPYFRIFNPVTQSEKFDPEGAFIKRYLPRLAGFNAKEIHAPWLASAARQREVGCIIGTDYPAPIVDHAEARERTL
ncbi:MAG TPA: deoxyribodipyrimidine photo-lyase, partial [Burkholderiaceae bacterium]|nr:deoxyribodipyrimidine photo-lyase [Burkholderiaceae bacterium]